MSTPADLFLVLEISAIDEWPSFGTYGTHPDGYPRRIPEARRPTVLQPSHATAIEEAKRLAAAHPGKRFAVFRASELAMTVDVPSHITVGGEVWLSRKVATVVQIDNEMIPF